MNKLVLIFACGVVGCAGDKLTGGACAKNDQCEAGEVCVHDQCARVCVADNECGGACCDNGICGASCSRQPPQIIGINGTGTPDGAAGHAAQHLEDRVVISGENFEGASVTLDSVDGTLALELCSSSATELVAVLPSDLSGGIYTLTVANQAGSCAATTTILQGEQGEAGTPGTSASVYGSTNIEVNSGTVGLKDDISLHGITLSSNISAAGGTFSGDLAAASGTFSGSLAAASGSFSGPIDVGGDVAAYDPAPLSGGPAAILRSETNAADGVARAVLRLSGTGAPQSFDVRRTTDNPDNYWMRVTGSDLYHVGNLHGSTVSVTSPLAWNNSGATIPSNGSTTIRGEQINHASCSADTRGEIRMWRLRDTNSDTTSIDSLCFCRRTVEAGVDSFRWVCFY